MSAAYEHKAWPSDGALAGGTVVAMLRITVEELPGGTGPVRTLAVLGVANISDLAETSSYVYLVRDDRGRESSGIVRGHRRSSGYWPLLARVARSAASTTRRVPLPRKWAEVAVAISHRL